MKKETKIKKAIVPVAGLGTRFLPLSKASPKELLPVVDKPAIQYIVEEIKKSGISEIVFVLNPKEKMIFEYFQKSSDIENILKKRKKKDLLKEIQEFKDLFKDIKFSYVFQKNPLGDGHAILQAENESKGNPVGVLFGDDIVDFEEPALLQLINVFETCNSPVVALKSLPEKQLSAYGIVKVEKIANRLYKIKEIVEKPNIEEAPSNLAIVGKYIITPDVFDYLKKATPSEKGEIILGEVLGKMIREGKMIYGYEIKGEWLECGDKIKWLKSFLYFALKDARFSGELKNYLREII